MRLIHQVIDDLRALPDAEVSPLGSAIEELLGGGQGSLPELTERFTRAGLGHIMASWFGDGPYLSISPGDLRTILGEERAEDLATLAGMPSDDFLVHLARLLPSAVHRVTADAEMEPLVAPRRAARRRGPSDDA